MADGAVIGNLTIPVIKGDKGDKGNTGEIISISLVLLSPSSTAYAINNGSTTQAQIELGIPKGLSVSTTNINASGELVFTFNDNSTVNVGQVVGKGISEVTVTDDFDFVVTYTDGTSVTACNLEEEILGTINDILESYYTKTEIDNKGFITKEVNNLTNYTLKTSTGSSIELSINSSTYVMTLNLKNSAGTTISTGTIDLPLETMVVGATYDNTNKKIVLTLKNGSTIDVPVADLISGLQSEINSNNKLSSDLVNDTNHTNKFVTASEKEQITTNATDISNIKDGTSIDSFGDVETALSGKEDSSNKTGVLNSSSTTTQYPHAKAVYDELVERDEEINQLWNDHPDILDNNALPSGTDITLQGTGDLKMKVDVGGNSTQETTSTSEGDEYDSPSPEHKQDINNVEGDVVAKGSSKNLFDKENALSETSININTGNTYVSQNRFATDYISIKNLTSYYCNGLSNATIIYGGLYDENKQFLQSLQSTNDTNNHILNISNSNAKYMRLAFLNEYLDTLQIEKGTTATSFVPFAENTVTFPLSQGQKLMLGDTLEDDGIYHKRAKVTANELKTVTTYVNQLTDFVRISFMISDLTNKVANEIPSGLCNYLKFLYDYSNESNHFYARSNVIYVFLEKTLLSSLNVTGVRAFLDEHPDLEIEYDLAKETLEDYTTTQQTAYNKLKEMQSYYDLTYVTGSSDNAQPIITAHAKKSLKVINDEISNINSRLTLLEE